jgi:hypothetical protein
MIYKYRNNEFDEQHVFHWRTSGKNYATNITKNGRVYSAQIVPLERSYRLTLVRVEDKKKIIELRFRDTELSEALVRAEYYILEYAE